MEEFRYIKRREDDFVRRNKVTPICLVIDRSGSMSGSLKDDHGYSRMERLNEGIKYFLQELRNDERLADTVKIAAVSFVDEVNSVTGEVLCSARVEQDFRSLEGCALQFRAGKGAGDIPAGVEMALDLLEKEKQGLKQNRIKHNQPWLVIMSDGVATTGRINPFTGKKDKQGLRERVVLAQNRVKALQTNDKLTVISVLINEEKEDRMTAYEKGLKEMQGFTNTEKCVEIASGRKKTSFKEFFKILTQSVSAGKNLFEDISSVRRDDKVTSSDYVSNEEVQKYIKVRNPTLEVGGATKSTEIIKEETIVIKPIKTIIQDETEEAQFLRKLQEDAAMEDTKAQEFYKKPQAALKKQITRPTVQHTIIEKTKTISTTASVTTDNASDDYLTELLNGLDDWDDL